MTVTGVGDELAMGFAFFGRTKLQRVGGLRQRYRLVQNPTTRGVVGLAEGIPTGKHEGDENKNDEEF